MEVEEAAGVRDIQQAEDRQLPDRPNRGAAVDAMAVQNATGSLEIMGQLVLNEWELLRHKIREFGVRIRQMSSKVAALTIKRLWNNLLSLLRKHGDSIPKQFELDAALILSEMEKAEVERPPPRDTFEDIRRVLLEEGWEKGVVQRRATGPWRAMPPKRRNVDVGSPMREGDTSAYQLFNRPMTVADDEFDRLSLPSTNFAQSESDKIMSLEAQLSMLTRQLNMIMVNGLPQAAGGGGSQRPSRPFSRSHSRASLYQNNQQMNASAHSSFGLPPSFPHLQQLQQSQLRLPHGGALSPSPTSDDDGVYMQDADSASSYASPSHTMIPLPMGMQQLQQLQQGTAAGIRQSMIMTGDASSAIPPAPPLPPFVLQAPPTGLQQQQVGAGHTPLAASPSSSTLVPYNKDDVDAEEEDLRSLSPPFSPLPPPPPAVVQYLQQGAGAAAAAAAMQRVNTQESALSTSGSRSFLDDINGGNFALRKTSSHKSPSDSIRSSTSGEETEQDENTVGPLVKPTTNQLLSRKVSLRRVSADRSPGGTPQNRNRRRAPSLGQDGGRTLYKGEYLAAALAKQFNSIHANQEDDDNQSVTAGDQSWFED